MADIPLNPEQVARLKKTAKEIAGEVQQFIDKHSTISVERTLLRLYGVDGVDDENVPLPNRLVEMLDDKKKLEGGVSRNRRCCAVLDAQRHGAMQG